jgi:D-sedoheptulose 7-phosphate isomerase
VLALDIDGVLTDGTAALSSGEKRFSFHDLDAVTRALRSSLEVVLVTGEDSPAVSRTAERFGVERVVRGAKDKLAALTGLANQLDISLDRFCYVGDGDRDAPALAQVGLGLAPANATPDAKASAHRVLSHSGGDGAVAEAISLVTQLRSQGERAAIIEQEMRQSATESLEAHRRLLGESLPVLVQVAQTFIEAIRRGRKILLFGNGGSAAEAQHVAGELIGRFARESDPWPYAIALSTDTSALTAIANDWDYSDVFARQVRGLAKPGDVVVGITTSGRSLNVLRGLEDGRRRGAITIGFTGATPGQLSELCDICLRRPRPQRLGFRSWSLLAWHIVCEVVERQLVEQ